MILNLSPFCFFSKFSARRAFNFLKQCLIVAERHIVVPAQIASLCSLDGSNQRAFQNPLSAFLYQPLRPSVLSGTDGLEVRVCLAVNDLRLGAQASRLLLPLGEMGSNSAIASWQVRHPDSRPCSWPRALSSLFNVSSFPTACPPRPFPGSSTRLAAPQALLSSAFLSVPTRIELELKPSSVLRLARAVQEGRPCAIP